MIVGWARLWGEVSEVRLGEVRWGGLAGWLGDNVVENSVGWWLMLVEVNNQVPLDIFWGQNTIYVSAAGGDLCLSSHSHWSRGLTPGFCWPTQAGAAAWSSLHLAPVVMEMLGLISISRTTGLLWSGLILHHNTIHTLKSSVDTPEAQCCPHNSMDI